MDKKNPCQPFRLAGALDWIGQGLVCADKKFQLVGHSVSKAEE